MVIRSGTGGTILVDCIACLMRGLIFGCVRVLDSRHPDRTHHLPVHTTRAPTAMLTPEGREPSLGMAAQDVVIVAGTA